MALSARIAFCDHDFPTSRINDVEWLAAEPTIIERYWNGDVAPYMRHCEVRMLWSDSALYVRFDANQGEPLVLFDDPDASRKRIGLWERDVCELFLAPDRDEPRRYAEFEIAPTGEWLDLIVDWTKDEPRDWEYSSGLEAFAGIEAESVIMVMTIPWTAFERAPRPGEVWAGNLFRQVGSGETRGYLAWSPTMTTEPQFHVPEKFGVFVFQS